MTDEHFQRIMDLIQGSQTAIKELGKDITRIRNDINIVRHNTNQNSKTIETLKNQIMLEQ